MLLRMATLVISGGALHVQLLAHDTLLTRSLRLLETISIRLVSEISSAYMKVVVLIFDCVLSCRADFMGSRCWKSPWQYRVVDLCVPLVAQSGEAYIPMKYFAFDGKCIISWSPFVIKSAMKCLVWTDPIISGRWRFGGPLYNVGFWRIPR